MLAGCFTILFQFIHVSFSLGGLLLFMHDLRGSIVINEAGEVVNYQDFGGGISSLFMSFTIAMLIYGATRIFKRNLGEKKAIVSYFFLLLSMKTAIIWNIYFSGRTDQRILEAYPLRAWIFIPDLAALILVIVLYKLLTLDIKPEKSDDQHPQESCSENE